MFAGSNQLKSLSSTASRLDQGRAANVKIKADVMLPGWYHQPNMSRWIKSHKWINLRFFQHASSNHMTYYYVLCISMLDLGSSRPVLSVLDSCIIGTFDPSTRQVDPLNLSTHVWQSGVVFVRDLNLAVFLVSHTGLGKNSSNAWSLKR